VEALRPETRSGRRIARAHSQPSAVGIASRYAVIEHKALLCEMPVESPAIERQILQPDVLEHADACDLVESLVFRKVAIIEQTNLATILHALRTNPLACEVELIAR